MAAEQGGVKYDPPPFTLIVTPFLNRSMFSSLNELFTRTK
jgi:hypothetical protein